MKLSHIATLSLAANLGLLGAVVMVRQKASTRTTAEAAEFSRTATNVSNGFKKAAKKRGAETAKAVPANPAPPGKFTWSVIEAAGYKQYIANLRGIECPEETIRDIILADVNKLYASRKKELHAKGDSGAKYWEQKPWWQQDQSVWRQDRALDKEKHKLLVDLLGVDPQKNQSELYVSFDYNQKMYPFLDEEKREQALVLAQKFQELETDVQRKYHGFWGEETYAEIKVVRDQRRAELAKLLTPQELEEFELRNSNVANQMSWEMREFDSNEQEFRSLFKVKQTFEDVMGIHSPDPDDKEAQKKYSDARKAMAEEIKQTLGDRRFRDYERSTDYQFQELGRMAKRQGLPADTAGKIYDMKDAAEQQATKVRSDQSLTAEQRREALKVIKSESENGVTQLLGEKAFKSYRDRNGYWLRSVGQ